MFKNIAAALIIAILIYNQSAVADPGTLSITDFTMHKVDPVQDKLELKPPIKQQKKPVIIKPVVKPVVKSVVKAQPQQKIKPQPEPKPEPKEVVVTPPEVEEVVSRPDEDAVKAIFDKQNYMDKVNSKLDSDPVEQQDSAMSAYNSYDYVLKPMISLSIVLLLIMIFAWLYQKLRGVNPNALLSGKFKDMDVNKFNVLASSALGQGKIIHLVEINGKQLVVGSTNNNISLLTEISPDDLDKLKAKAGSKMKPDVQVNAARPQPVELDELEHTEPESYSARYNNVYRDYLD